MKRYRASRPENLQTEWARLLLASLADAGVRDVVLSPGARSTPFTWAALGHPDLRARSIIDERCAAFFAVGHARMTGDPVLLICTSGSAAANYLPAVVEASESATPLLILTADRGLELQHAAAPQTIDQAKLFGGYVRDYFDLGSPDPHPRMLQAVQRLAAQAVLGSRSPDPGPVHLNARARKPLGPQPAGDATAEVLRDHVDGLIRRGPATFFPAEAVPDPAAIRELAEACRGARRGLIVCGPTAPTGAPDSADVAALADASGFPVVAEPASQQRFAPFVDGRTWVDAFAALLTVPAFRDAHGPDMVLQLGRPPTASEWTAYLDRWPEADRYVISPGGWPDPWSSARAVVRAPLTAAVRELTRSLRAGQEDQDAARERGEWLERLQAANRGALAVIEHALTGPFSEGAAVRAVVDAVPEGGVLALGNSLPIREAETFVPAAARSCTVWAQRGANGIDGLISGAAGAAASGSRPTTLLLGDVSFAHDIGGLASARDAGAGLTIVVLNNGGGRIFERLPMAGALSEDASFQAWLTPTDLDISAAAASYGIGYARATDRAELDLALREAQRASGTHVIEVVVPPDGTTEHQRQLADQLAQRLETGSDR